MANCKHCGLSEAEHHWYEPQAEPPDGCKCDPGTWKDGHDFHVPPICPAYKGDGFQYCGTCEHDFFCHAEVAP